MENLGSIIWRPSFVWVEIQPLEIRVCLGQTLRLPVSFFVSWDYSNLVAAPQPRCTSQTKLSDCSTRNRSRCSRILRLTKYQLFQSRSQSTNKICTTDALSYRPELWSAYFMGADWKIASRCYCAGESPHGDEKHMLQVTAGCHAPNRRHNSQALLCSAARRNPRTRIFVVYNRSISDLSSATGQSRVSEVGLRDCCLKSS